MKNGTDFITKGKKPDSLLMTEFISRIISFLQMSMTETLAKRIVSMILLAVGTPNIEVTELTGLCNRSVRELRKNIQDKNIWDNLFYVGGGGRKRKS